MNTSRVMLVVLASVAALLAVTPASPSNGPAVSTILSPIVDGTATDTDGDGRGDVTYDGLGSVVVGYAHSALESGEHRGVFEFELAALEHRCAESAQLLLNVAGSFGPTSDIPFLYPNYTLYAGTGDGVLTAGDYSNADLIASLTFRTDVAIDVTAVVRSALHPWLVRDGTTPLRFVLAWDTAPSAVAGGLLFGSNELEEVHGDEFRATRLAVQTTPGSCL
jgi:hypothetical protein